ncbi:MAG: hypothetical protein ACOC35_11990 [Promethearchaeia archaeon]
MSVSLINLKLRKDKKNLIHELLVPILIFGCHGVFYWAIRGTGGYGGSSGAVFAGLGWALAWYFLSYESSEKKKRPYSSGWVVAAITLGIGLGGLHGYGQFMTWIKGEFCLDSTNCISLNPLVGYAWLFQCGLAWGGMGGIFLAWTGSRKPPTSKDWIFRIVFAVGGALIGFFLTYYFPGLINPAYDRVDYTNFATCPDCKRTLSTSLSSMTLLGIFLGLLLYEMIRKEWRGVLLTLTIALGFALAFSIFAFWHYGPQFSDLDISWWKNWEMSIGFIGGASFGLAYYIFNRPYQDDHISMIRQQPFSQRPNAEKLIGMEFTTATALGWSIYNGIGGFLGKFELKDSWRWHFSLPFIAVCLAYFLYHVYKVKKEPFQVGEDQTNIKKPVVRFVIGHAILVILGYMVAYNIEINFNNAYLLSLYTVFLIIGAVVVIIRIKF